ncbi:hypothetical protein G647_00082 [Cladophialophora carrionii CBS 160.54]|uniref:Sigma-70 region 2 family protein n=1 Tax=Cladophialophora carrionii CBS 160.54 TaxID=1279043 RepID=V9DMT8_9EURO|nr:uncharacterized protein G647_00082 [Cladophialophora carrionii CBS 160.54]ETI27633.1 hypothetical protein G647_00082 [Cladophialophora carrionii CBS 160.54]
MASGSRKPQRRFQFIDNSNVSSSGSNSTQVRRHVMQEYMREKRWEARSHSNIAGESHPPTRKRGVKARSQSRPTHKREERETSPAFEPGDALRCMSLQGAPKDQREHQSHHDDPVEEIVRHNPDLEAVPNDPRPAFSLGSSAFAKLADMVSKPLVTPPSSVDSPDRTSPPNWQWLSCGATSQSPEPQSYLSAARTDPFDCLPIKLSAQDQELFDFYANVMPACSYGFERRSPRAHNWYLTVFIPEAMKGAVCFQNTILVHAANTQAWVQGLPETRLAIEHRAKASQLLLHHYQQHPHDTSDATISATISAAALEDFDPRIERRIYAWMHWEAVVQKIRDRGGPTALVQNNRLQMLINWSDYIFSGYKGQGATFYFDHQSSPRHTTEQEAESIGRTEIAQQTEEFITFLKCAEHLALVQAGMQSNPVSRRQQPLRFSVFLPGQPLYNLLASPNGARYTDTGQFKQIISRLGALMTINTAIWEYRHSTEFSEEFFAELMDNIMHNELDQHISVEALIQILLSGSKNPVLLHTERPWFVGRMLKVSKRLSRPTFERLNELLLSFLTLGPELSPVMVDWENELRTEILRAPLISYRSRFMMEPA